MRLAALAFLIAALGAMQFASDGLLDARAAAVAVPRLISHAASRTLFASLAALPFAPPFLRTVDAGTAVEDGRLAEAQDAIARIPPGRERDDLEGRVLAAQGDHHAAVVHFIAAGDLARVGDTVDALLSAGNLSEAIGVQSELVARLAVLGDEEGLAHAQWRLAQLESQAGQHAKALKDYQAALKLVPLSETYLLGAANEALGQGRLDLAMRYFRRVLALDPASHDGKVGVSRVEAQRHAVR